MVELDKQARSLASETPLQRAAVELDAIGNLLEILVRQADSKAELKDALDEISNNRRKASANAANVLEEMRDSCYFSVALWDLLNKLRR